jgi:hypothetical protein
MCRQFLFCFQFPVGGNGAQWHGDGSSEALKKEKPNQPERTPLTDTATYK